MANQSSAASSGDGRPDPEGRPTCFVLIGFGYRTDFTTGRVLSLDATYERLIQPACDRAGLHCFRGIDANVTGGIDNVTFAWLHAADVVIADLSTLNPQVFYELGVRHALRPRTTITIAESVLMRKIPFDLSNYVIFTYDHAGYEIDEAERTRFVELLSGVLAKAVEADDPGDDSPVYTFLSGMEPPDYDPGTRLEPPAYVPPEERRDRDDEAGKSLASVVRAAEWAKNRKDFQTAIELFKKAIELHGDKPDVFLAQRLALVTYKSGQTTDADGNLDTDAAVRALLEAERILEQYCAPRISTDPETLGLSGAVNKRLFDLTADLGYLDRALRFYERGFYVKQDYYTGINVAFMYTLRANLLDDRFEAIHSFVQANRIRQRVVEICEELLAGDAVPPGEKQWLYMTLAEAYQGMGLEKELARLLPEIEEVASPFGMDAYQAQKKKLQAEMEEFDRRMRAGAPADAAPEATAAVASAAFVAAPAPAAAFGRPTPPVDEVGRWADELLRRIGLRLAGGDAPAPAAPGISQPTVAGSPRNDAEGADAGAPDESPAATAVTPRVEPVPERPPRTTVFISYSHKDSELLERVKVRLRPLQQAGLKVWDDSKIQAGDQWRREIDEAMAGTKVALLLITENYLDSDFITNNELPPFLDAAEKEGAIILSLIGRRVFLSLNPTLSSYQAVNNPDTEVLNELSEAGQAKVLVRLQERLVDIFNLKGRVSDDPRRGL